MQSTTATTWSMRFMARRDLRIQANTDRKPAAYFNVLDPITRQSYRLGELEYVLLASLNGDRTLRQVLKRLRRDRQYESLGEQHLLATVEQLQQYGLVRSSRVASKSGLGVGIARAQNTPRAQAMLSGFVAWQVRGWQPDAWLAKLAPQMNAIFAGAAVRFWMLLALLTCGGVLLEFPRLMSQSAAWQWIVHPVQGSALFTVFLFTRGLHELGHALVCKRHGVRCPDIGLFIVLGAPCVYCDVSESWQLPSRWQRAAVAAAGMYVELIVATLAAWVWLLTLDGPANTVALQTMFVCSVSTVLINANPLMRFDGYYILSDILDESNLRGRADGIAEARLYRWILGPGAVLQAKVERNAYGHLMCIFSWMGWLYRAGLSLAIAGLLVAIYDAWNIAWFGRLIAVLILISWWGVPSVKLVKNLVQIARKSKTCWRLTLLTAAFFGCLCVLPVPYRQFAGGWVQPDSMRGVYSPASGILECSQGMPTSGTWVTEGTELFSVHDIDALQDVMRAEGMRDRAKAELDGHQQAQSKESDTSQKVLENAEKRLRVAQAELAKRKLKAPCDGKLLVMLATPPTGPWSLESVSQTNTWDSATQTGRLISTGTMLATICGSEMVAIIPLNDSQLEWIASGVEVRLRCAEHAAKVYTCKVDKVVPLEDVHATWRLMNGDLTETAANSSGLETNRKKGAAVYAAQVRLPEAVVGAVGARVDGVFVAPSQTVASLGYRWLQQNLRWLAD